MKLSKLAISFLLFIAIYAFVITSYPSFFEEKNQEKCSILFFIVGISATIIYNIVDSFYK